MTDVYNEEVIPEKTYYIEYNAPRKSFLEQQTADFALFLTCTALEGFPIVLQNGKMFIVYDDPRHFGFKVTLPISYEKELEDTLIGTGFNIINN